MGYINFYDASIPLHEESSLIYREGNLDVHAVKGLERRYDIPDQELMVGLFTEVMADRGNPYLGTLGEQAPVDQTKQYNLAQVSGKFKDPYNPNWFVPTGYVGEPLGEL